MSPLHVRRQRKGLKQRDVAAHLGVTDTRVVRWEYAKGIPTVAQLVALGELFGEPVLQGEIA